MSGDEPRRSGRATKGQHNKLEATPEPKGKVDKKGGKKGKKATDTASQADEDEAEVIRCICGNDNPSDKRPFIGCDACSVWQHNVCMGMPDDEDDVGEHYFCEQCRPEEHGETLEALAAGENIWETRNKIWQNEKKKGKRKSRGGDEKQGWLKRELREDDGQVEDDTPAGSIETGTKRKRAVKEEDEVEDSKPQKPARGRLEKRRKAETKPDPDTALVTLEDLPADRQKVAKALSTLLAGDIQERVKSGTYKLKGNATAESLGEHHGLRIEYSLHINHGGPSAAAYGAQFRTLNANLKRNKTLIQELLADHLTADELSTMSSSDMASEELQRERAEMKAEADRQAVIDTRDDGPRYRRTHKGDEIVEGEAAASSSAPIARPVRHSATEADIAAANTAGSPTEGNDERRASKDNFDVKDIWAKTGATDAARPIPARQRSTVQTESNNGTKVDADVDRLLADDDEDYTPNEYPEGVVWQGKIVHTTGDLEPMVNARWVAGRDISQTIAWTQLLADRLNIDGRLQIQKAEEYLCGLQWSKTSDVSVLAITPVNDSKSFNEVFDYFKTRDRYAVVHKDKPALLVKDLYIIPVEAGSKLPEHVSMLEHCTLKQPVEERVLLATFVVSRAPIESPQKPTVAGEPTNGQQYAHMRSQSMPGPAASPVTQFGAGSPLNPSGPAASPFNTNGPAASPINPSAPQHSQGYAAQGYNPQYTVPVSAQQYDTSRIAPEVMQMAVSILGNKAYCPSAQQILAESAALTQEQVQNMSKIFTEDERTCNDFGLFVTRLMGPQ